MTAKLMGANNWRELVGGKSAVLIADENLSEKDFLRRFRKQAKILLDDAPELNRGPENYTLAHALIAAIKPTAIAPVVSFADPAVEPYDVRSLESTFAYSDFSKLWYDHCLMGDIFAKALCRAVVIGTEEKPWPVEIYGPATMLVYMAKQHFEKTNDIEETLGIINAALVVNPGNIEANVAAALFEQDLVKHSAYLLRACKSAERHLTEECEDWLKKNPNSNEEAFWSDHIQDTVQNAFLMLSVAMQNRAEAEPNKASYFDRLRDHYLDRLGDLIPLDVFQKKTSAPLGTFRYADLERPEPAMTIR